MDATFTIDEIGDLFGLSRDERAAIVETLLAARRPQPPPLQHPDDLLTPDERDRLYADLARMANTRRQVASWAATQQLP